MAREILRWDPFRELEAHLPAKALGAFIPDFDVKETKDSYVFKADLPGVKESELEISLTGSRLTISGKRESEEREEENANYFTYERSYGSFSRSFTLPEGVDEGAIRADLKDGVLTLLLPKRPEVQAKKITLGTGGGEKKEKAKA
jgi:HSP20 family protein